MKRTLAGLLAAAGLFAATPAVSPVLAAGKHGPVAQAACKKATIGGQSRCIARGQFCARRYERDYRRGATLIPPVPPATRPCSSGRMSSGTRTPSPEALSSMTGVPPSSRMQRKFDVIAPNGPDHARDKSTAVSPYGGG